MTRRSRDDLALGPTLWAGLNQRIRREPYRAVDSAGETIEFVLSPKRDLVAAKPFLRLALSGRGLRPG